MLALHLLQSALVLIKTRMVDRILTDASWAERLTEPDQRGMTTVLVQRRLHGKFELDCACGATPPGRHGAASA